MPSSPVRVVDDLYCAHIQRTSVSAARRNGGGASSMGADIGMAVRARSQGSAAASGVWRGRDGGGVAQRLWLRVTAGDEAVREEEERRLFKIGKFGPSLRSESLD